MDHIDSRNMPSQVIFYRTINEIEPTYHNKLKKINKLSLFHQYWLKKLASNLEKGSMGAAHILSYLVTPQAHDFDRSLTLTVIIVR